MSRTLSLLCVLALSVVVSAEYARPNLAGTWKLDPASGSATGGGSGGGRGQGNSRGGGVGLGASADTLVITQTSQVVTVEERYGSVRNSVVYPVDGKKVFNKVGVGRGAGVPVEFTSRWKDDYLLATFAVPVDGRPAPRQYELRLSLERRDGRKNTDVLLLEIKEIGTTNSRMLVYRK